MGNLIKLLLISCVFGVSHGFIDSDVIQAIQTFGTSDILVNFRGDNSKAIKSVAQKSFRSRLSKVKALTDALHSLADQSQGPLQNYLKQHNVESQSFWSSNQMVLKGVNLNLVKAIDSFPQVSKVQTLPRVELEPTTPSSFTPMAGDVEWGVQKIGADQVWAQFGSRGEGVVVANIDTGVRGSHEALKGNFRKEHGWYDPYDFSEKPHDGNGHGTHTMGTICGQNGIGVAPGATWIACRGCGSDSCDSAQLLACGQWMLAPTLTNGSNPDPSLIPDVVCNSWGSSIGGSNWYNATIEAWTAAGIMHAFAIGNSGPRCRSGGSPGDQPTTFSVGSTDIDDKLSLFSSKGPAGSFLRSYIKPDISAPGSDVRSAWHTNDTDYNTISGTSMATPHVTGVLALMLSTHRNVTKNASARLDFYDTVDVIEKTAVRQGLTLSTLNYRCPILFARDGYPNNQFGHGRIDALAAVNVTYVAAASSAK